MGGYKKMASKRMFSLRIIDTARFIRMPISCQALYFHLALRADDDGVVEAYNVMRLLGCSEDDLRVLVAKQFIQVLNEDLVTYINDWSEHNSIRADRKIDSIYKDLLISINPDIQLVEKKQRADVKKVVEVVEEVKKEMACTIEVPKKEEPKKVEEPTKRTRKVFVKPTLEEVQAYCKERKNSVDAQRFIDFYESKGWKVGTSPMKDWKASIRTWEKRQAPQSQANNGLPRGSNSDFDDLKDLLDL